MLSDFLLIVKEGAIIFRIRFYMGLSDFESALSEAPRSGITVGFCSSMAAPDGGSVTDWSLLCGRCRVYWAATLDEPEPGFTRFA